MLARLILIKNKDIQRTKKTDAGAFVIRDIAAVKAPPIIVYLRHVRKLFLFRLLKTKLRIGVLHAISMYLSSSFSNAFI